MFGPEQTELNPIISGSSKDKVLPVIPPAHESLVLSGISEEPTDSTSPTILEIQPKKSRKPAKHLSEAQTEFLVTSIIDEVNGNEILHNNEYWAQHFGVSRSHITRTLSRARAAKPELQAVIDTRKDLLLIERGRTLGNNSFETGTGMFRTDPETGQSGASIGRSLGGQSMRDNETGMFRINPEDKQYAAEGRERGLESIRSHEAHGSFKAGVRTYRLHQGIHADEDLVNPRQLTEEQKIRFIEKGIRIYKMTVSELSNLLGLNPNETRIYIEKAGVSPLSRSEINRTRWARRRSKWVARIQSRRARRLRGQSIKEVWEGRSDEERVIIHRPSEEARRQITQRAMEQVFGDRNPLEVVQALAASGLSQKQIIDQLSTLSPRWVKNFMQENKIKTQQRDSGRFTAYVDPKIRKQVQEIDSQILIERLTERQFEVINLRYLSETEDEQNKSFTKVAEKMGISRARAKQLDTIALSKLGISKTAEVQPVQTQTTTIFDSTVMPVKPEQSSTRHHIRLPRIPVQHIHIPRIFHHSK